jgi:tRNA threonylcarbamoyl adenosine modification protein YeaZ
LKILSFDASTAELHLSLSDANELAASAIIRPDADQRRYTASEMIPAIDDLLKSKNCKKTDLDAVAVGIGPGSFTGVRVAVVVARTLGQALKIPVLGISIFDCYAKLIKEPFTAITDAGGNFAYVASYVKSKGVNGGTNSQIDSLSQTEPPQCVKIEELPAMLKEAARRLVAPSLVEKLQSLAEVEPLPELNNIALLQSEIAAYRLSLKESPKGHQTDGTYQRAQLVTEFPYQSVRPLYLRQASITLKSFSP